MPQRMDLANDRNPSDVIFIFDAAPRAADARRVSIVARSMSACRVVATLMLTALVGCSGSDLSGYRPLDKVAKSKNGETSPAPEQPVNAVAVVEAANAIHESDPATDSDNIGLSELPPVSALAPINVVDGANVESLWKVMPDEAVSALTPSTIEQAATPPTTAAEPRKVEILIPEKTFRTDATSKALRVAYDDLDLLKVINMEPVTADAVDHMPQWLKGLSGQRIKIRGFMYPTFETEDIERFILARDNQICCFGRDPKIYDLIQIDMRVGKTTNYIPWTRSFDVIGRLKIEMIAEDGKPFGLYYLEDAEVIDR